MHKIKNKKKVISSKEQKKKIKSKLRNWTIYTEENSTRGRGRADTGAPSLIPFLASGGVGEKLLWTHEMKQRGKKEDTRSGRAAAVSQTVKSWTRKGRKSMHGILNLDKLTFAPEEWQVKSNN